MFRNMSLAVRLGAGAAFWQHASRQSRTFASTSTAAAAAAPDFGEIAVGKDLSELSQTFNEIYGMQFPNPSTRRAILMSMRTTYCRKMLEECNIDSELLEE